MLTGCASGHPPCSPVPDTRDVICKAASCAGVRSAEPPAHESPPSPRVCRARRPGSLKITSSCVRHGGGAVTLSAPPFPRRPRNRPLRCRPRASLPGIRPARPSLGAQKFGALIKPCSMKSRRRAGQKIAGRIKRCWCQVRLKSRTHLYIPSLGRALPVRHAAECLRHAGSVPVAGGRAPCGP